MKYLLLLSLVLTASCASQPKLALRPLLPASIAPTESVRYPEVVRAYQVGRLVDPAHPELMVEAHPVYRLEVSPRWNLHPGSSGATNLLNPPPDAAFAPPPVNDAVIAEINRQRETTALVMQQATRLAQSCQQLQGVIGEMKTVAKNDAILNARISATEQRVANFEKQLDKDAISSVSATNDVSRFSSESDDSSEP